ncbi:MAG TPA: DUF3592 domain-containing protein [Candidatus Eisenbacteria bacterium]|jgi:hypothetical protein
MPLLSFGTVFGLFLMGGSATTLFSLLSTRNEILRAKSWLSTPGTITRSEVEAYWKPIGSNWTRLYRPLVEYSFEVRGEPFSGKRISLITINTSFKSMAETEARQFVVGAKVTVYFNPSDPRQCVLDRRGPKDDSGALIVMALAGAAFLAGLLAVSGALKLG